MKLTRTNLGNIAIAAIALLLFSAFVVLATKGGDKDNNLATVASTTSTTEPATTTTEPLATTTTLALATSTTAPVTATTVRTTTTAQPRATTTTAHDACAHGHATELSDNKNTFTYGTNGWASANSSDRPNSSTFPLAFTIQTGRGPTNSQYIQFEIRLTNNTACTATFGDNLVIAVTVHPTAGGDDQTFTVAPENPKVTDIKSHETIVLKQERSISGTGTFEATGACDINYG